MTSPVAQGLTGLSHCRAVLVRVTAGLTVEDLDYRQFPDSKSNGEILLHIAGFEFLTIAAARMSAGERADLSLWPRLKSGFAREAGFVPPRARTLEAYLEMLTLARVGTAAFLSADDRAGRVRLDGMIEQLAQALAGADSGEDADHYRRLAAGVRTSFADDGAPDAEGRVDLTTMLALHETYHRGQITLNKYIRSRAARRDAALI